MPGRKDLWICGYCLVVFHPPKKKGKGQTANQAWPTMNFDYVLRTKKNFSAVWPTIFVLANHWVSSHIWNIIQPLTEPANHCMSVKYWKSTDSILKYLSNHHSGIQPWSKQTCLIWKKNHPTSDWDSQPLKRNVILSAKYWKSTFSLLRYLFNHHSGSQHWSKQIWLIWKYWK